MSIKRRAIGTVAATLLTFGLVSTQAPIASAAAYDGQLPGVGNTCDASASTVRQADIGTLGWIELRYSSVCRTAWARVYSYNGYQPSVAFSSTAKVHRNSDGLQYSCTFTTAGQHSCYTKMVNDSGVTSYAWGEIDNGLTWITGQTTSY